MAVCPLHRSTVRCKSSGGYQGLHLWLNLVEALLDGYRPRISAWPRRWPTAAASPHKTLSFALPFDSAPSMATAAFVTAPPLSRLGHASRAIVMSPGTVFGVTILRFICFTWCHLAPSCHYTSTHPSPTRRRDSPAGVEGPPHNRLPPWPPLPRPPTPMPHTRHTAPHRHRPHPLLLQLISITVRLYSRSRNNLCTLSPLLRV